MNWRRKRARRFSAAGSSSNPSPREPRAIYGINTGFGPLSGFRVSNADLAQHQINLLHHLTVGQGALFSEAETRAIMLTRANALARGYSGIRERTD